MMRAAPQPPINQSVQHVVHFLLETESSSELRRRWFRNRGAERQHAIVDGAVADIIPTVDNDEFAALIPHVATAATTTGIKEHILEIQMNVA
jgi:hypothetical protein